MNKSLKINLTATKPRPELIPPHLHSGTSVAAFHWKKVVALLPLCGVCVWHSGLKALGIFTASLAGGLAAEILAETFLKKKLKLSDGSAVLNCLLFALMIPPGAPFWMPAAGAFFGLLIGREIFGGLAAGLFLPALVGRIFLEACFPSSISSSAVLFGGGWPAGIAVLAGAVLLISWKLIFWEAPLFYLASIFIFFLVFRPGLFSPALFFSAFFLLTDSASTPVSVWGRRIFAAAAGMGVFFFNQWGAPMPFVVALLTAEILTPWLDRLTRPAGGV